MYLPRTKPHAPERGEAEREREAAGVRRRCRPWSRPPWTLLMFVLMKLMERPVEGEEDALDGVEEAEPEEARDRLRGEQVVGEVGEPRVDLDVVRVVADRWLWAGDPVARQLADLSRGALAAGRRSSAQVAERVAGGGGRGRWSLAPVPEVVGAGRRRRRVPCRPAGRATGRGEAWLPGWAAQRACRAARTDASRAAAIPRSAARSPAGIRADRRNWRRSRRPRGRTGRRRPPLAPARQRSTEQR